MADVQDSIRITVKEDGSREATANIAGVGTSAEKSATALELFKKALELAVAAETIHKLVELADAGTRVSNILHLATAETGNFQVVLSKVYDTAIKTGTSARSLAELFDSLTVAGKDYGVTQKQALDITNTLAEAFALEGGSAEEAGGAITALSRALVTGQVQARTFITIFTQAPAAAEILAKAFHEKFTDLVADIQAGRISSEQLFQALIKAGPAIEKAFADTPRTIGQAFSAIGTSLEHLLLMINQSSGSFNNLAKFFIALAQSSDILAPALGILLNSFILLVEGGVDFAAFALVGLIHILNDLGLAADETVVAADKMRDALADVTADTIISTARSFDWQKQIEANKKATDDWSKSNQNAAGSLSGSLDPALKQTTQDLHDVAFGFELVQQAQGSIDQVPTFLLNSASAADTFTSSMSGAAAATAAGAAAAGAAATGYDGLASAFDSAASAASSAASAIASANSAASSGGGLGGPSNFDAGLSAYAPSSGSLSLDADGNIIWAGGIDPFTGAIGEGDANLQLWQQNHPGELPPGGNLVRDFGAGVAFQTIGGGSGAQGGFHGDIGALIQKWLAAAYKNPNVGSLTDFLHALGVPGFMDGGEFTVGGNGGPDTTPVTFLATPGEKVTVTPPGKEDSRKQRPIIVNFTVHATDANSFRNTSRQVVQNISEAIRISEITR